MRVLGGAALVVGGAFLLLLLARVSFSGGQSAGAGEQAKEASRAAPWPEERKLTGVLGRKVEHRDGHCVGTLKELVLDMRDGKIRMAIVSGGGFLGLGKTTKAVAADKLSVVTAKRNTLALNLTKKAWEQVPEIKDAESAMLVMQRKNLPLERDFEQAVVGAERPARFALATDLLGKSVSSHQEGKIGEIRDLLVDFGGTKPVMAVVASAESFRGAPADVIIPLALAWASKGQLLVDVELKPAEQASFFDRETGLKPVPPD